MAEQEKYELFFEEIKKFQEEQNKQKQRGLNDYNMVNVVRKETAEVGMHSNVIYSLIDPFGLHYQGDLFLQHFIREVLTDLKDNFGEILSVDAEESTYENRRIDFTIKSSQYYIGIEMKIDANDLEEQISHYYNDLVEKAKNDNHQEVYIYYLTKDGKEAAPHSSKEVKYVQVSFAEHILNWISACQNEVRNITNLNEAFENYKTIVKKITNQYKGKVMALEDALYEDEEKFKLSEFIHIAYLKALKKRVEENKKDFFNSLKDKLSSLDIEYKKESGILIPIQELEDGASLKLLIEYKNNNELLATLFKKSNNGEWQKGVYNDNEKITQLIEKTKGMRKIGIYGYFTINICPNINFKNKTSDKDIDDSYNKISEVYGLLKALIKQ